ncbi:MAG: hypothetical protein ACE5JI_07065 [Acidobacteriota bacterium]
MGCKSFLPLVLVAAFTGLSISSRVKAQPELQTLTKDQIKLFLRTARVIKSRPITEGSTEPWCLTLSDGNVTHDAAFQTIDMRRRTFQLEGGRTEVNFVDSYLYNIAAFDLAELLGLDDMVPVTVERRWRSKTGALSWWIDAKWDENSRQKQGLRAPDLDAWNKQIFKVRVFAELICDTDRNRGNLLITEDWNLWMIDFTRAFRRWHKLEAPPGLKKCDRRLFEKLKQLRKADVEQSLTRHLSGWEIEALMARRDLIVAHFEKLIAARGEKAVLY